MPGNTSKRYPPELRQRAVRMAAEIRGEHDSEWAAMARVAELLGVTATESVRKWVRQAEVDVGSRPGTGTEESEQVRRVQAGERGAAAGERDLEGGVGFFAAELDRPRG